MTTTLSPRTSTATEPTTTPATTTSGPGPVAPVAPGTASSSRRPGSPVPGAGHLTARSAGWIVAGIVAVAATSAGFAWGQRSAETPASVGSAVVAPSTTDAQESLHGSGTSLSTGSGQRVELPAAESLPASLVAGDSVGIAHGQAGSLVSSQGLAIDPHAAPAPQLVAGDSVGIAHGDAGAVTSSTGTRVATAPTGPLPPMAATSPADSVGTAHGGAGAIAATDGTPVRR
ncbi:MAG: hypothetical protein GC157_10155 [Frankiales bacterium]|nr:hypothetical protein [Frankiales bacterium]